MATSRADDWRGESQRWLHRNGFQFDGYYNGDKTLSQDVKHSLVVSG